MNNDGVGPGTSSADGGRTGFWSDRIWLPKGVNWTDLERHPGHPEFSHAFLVIPYACLMLLFRFAFEEHVARPFGRFLGLRDRRRSSKTSLTTTIPSTKTSLTTSSINPLPPSAAAVAAAVVNNNIERSNSNSNHAVKNSNIINVANGGEGVVKTDENGLVLNHRTPSSTANNNNKNHLINGHIISSNDEHQQKQHLSSNKSSDDSNNHQAAAGGGVGEDSGSQPQYHPGPDRLKEKLLLEKGKRKSTLDKFSECCFRNAYYFSIFVYGSRVLWNKSWFWDTRECWIGYPLQSVDLEIYWYYMIQSSFYCSLMISQFTDVKRKDFWMFVFHHVVTIFLLWLSWMDNFVRIGAVVMLVHDIVDFWLESAKMARYAGFMRLSDFFFACFAAIWIISRNFIYPYKILYSTIFEVYQAIGTWPLYYVFNLLLISLQGVHCLWTLILLKAIRETIVTGKIEDVRSDSEDSETESAAPVKPPAQEGLRAVGQQELRIKKDE